MKATKWLALCLLASLFAGGCHTPSVEEGIFWYKNSYIGDASAVGNILSQLPGREHFQGMELKTAEKPYGLIVRYDRDAAPARKELFQELTLYNASYLLALVHNADWIEFQWGEFSRTITREELNSWYGEDVRGLEREEELRQRIDTHLAWEHLVEP